MRVTLGLVLRELVPEHVAWTAISLVDQTGRSRFAALRDGDAARQGALDAHAGQPDDVPMQHAGATARVVTLRGGGDVVGRLHLGPRMPLSGASFDAVVEHCAVALVNACRFERERRVAVTFQNAALASLLPIHSGYAFDAVYETGRSDDLVGGDWYDAFTLDDGRIVVSIGDVSGSGLHAAIAMVNVRQSIRGVAQVHPDAALMLEAADRTLRTQHADKYVTAFVGVIDPVTQRCAYANAGHPRPIVRLEDGLLVRTTGGGIPLGLAFEAERPIGETLLPPGAMLLLYTDGLSEATRDVLEGERRIEAALRALPASCPTPARAVHDDVLAGPARDDVAILVVTARHAPPVRRWRFDPRWSDVAQRARAEVRATLAAAGFSEDELTDAEMIFSELAGNAIRHAPGTVELLLETHERFALHLLDRGPGFQFSARLPNDLYSQFGRGLFLIDALAERFAVEHRAGGGSHSRVVLRHQPRGEPPCQ